MIKFLEDVSKVQSMRSSQRGTCGFGFDESRRYYHRQTQDAD
jgi:hypothetical protein